ncbi:uncharacterized protein LOC142980858 [Anticarsia gemmatalis]|uniref:uncharacterized protein LOC142980858 n=1 Tax=Anticarsia gemmatalis TaxID=129554 RepID=UPI003F75DB53
MNSPHALNAPDNNDLQQIVRKALRSIIFNYYTRLKHTARSALKSVLVKYWSNIDFKNLMGPIKAIDEDKIKSFRQIYNASVKMELGKGDQETSRNDFVNIVKSDKMRQRTVQSNSSKPLHVKKHKRNRVKSVARSPRTRGRGGGRGRRDRHSPITSTCATRMRLSSTSATIEQPMRKIRTNKRAVLRSGLSTRTTTNTQLHNVQTMWPEKEQILSMAKTHKPGDLFVNVQTMAQVTIKDVNAKKLKYTIHFNNIFPMLG